MILIASTSARGRKRGVYWLRDCSSKEDDGGMIRLLATMLVICGAGLLAAAPLGAVPKPPPKFWSAARCERTMLSRQGTPRQAICIGIGGPSACRWTKGRARLYSEFRVFTRYEQLYVPAARSGQFDVVRALTLSTRARPGFARIVHHYGDPYAGWPADYFIRHVTVLATDVSQARFRPLVAPIAARLKAAESTNCTGA